jgi:hypothetical protein
MPQSVSGAPCDGMDWRHVSVLHRLLLIVDRWNCAILLQKEWRSGRNSECLRPHRMSGTTPLLVKWRVSCGACPVWASRQICKSPAGSVAGVTRRASLAFIASAGPHHGAISSVCVVSLRGRPCRALTLYNMQIPHARDDSRTLATSIFCAHICGIRR